MAKKFSLKKQKQEKPLIIKLMPHIVVITILIIWELAVVIFKIPRTVLPSPHAIVIKTVQNFWDTIAFHFYVSLRTAVLGMLISIPLGIGLASVCSQFKVLTAGCTPIFLFFCVTPMLTLVPLFMVWLGFDWEPRFLEIVVAATPLIALNTMYGFMAVPNRYIELMRGYGASKFETFIKVIFPNALPQVFTGIGLGGIVAVTTATSIEMVAGQPGLGYRVMYFSKMLQTELLFGTIFCIAVLGTVMWNTSDKLKQKIVYWM